MLDQVNTTAALVVVVCAAVAALAGAYRVLWHGSRDKHTGRLKPGLIRGVLLDLRGFRDAILGREPIVDSITGQELAPALPDIGQRMASQEQQMAILTEAVAKIADSHRRIDDLDERVTALEQQKVERALGRVESIQLLQTMETAIGADPARDDDALP